MQLAPDRRQRDVRDRRIDRGDDRYAKIRQVIRCRNDFVHPKGLSVQILNSDKAEARLSGGREYPIAFDFIELNQVVLMIGDILRFVAWVVFDICEFSPSAGAKLINGEIKWWMSQFHDAQTLWKYDLRSLGNFENVKVTTISLSSSKKHRTIRRSRNVRKK